MSHPPFATGRPVWSPGKHITRLRFDPDAPHRFAAAVGDGYDGCPTNDDIYVSDLDTIDTVPPRAVTDTTDHVSQEFPVFRADRVAHVDFTGDTIDPAGRNPHSVSSLVVTCISSRVAQTLMRDDVPMSPVWLGLDRVYVGRRIGGWGYVMFPP